MWRFRGSERIRSNGRSENLKLYYLIYYIGTLRSRKIIIQHYGKDFYEKFRVQSKHLVINIIEKTPNIGRTLYSFNYAFAPAYIAWYKTARALGVSKEQTDHLLWDINESFFRIVPTICTSLYMSHYLNNFRRKAPIHEKLSNSNQTHPYDFKIKFQSIDKNTFEIDIYECGMMKLAKDFDALEMFPSICRVDYLLSNIMGAGFERTKTLGDGNDCCNCRYIKGGYCPWSPEKGFEERK